MTIRRMLAGRPCSGSALRRGGTRMFIPLIMASLAALGACSRDEGAASGAVPDAPTPGKCVAMRQALAAGEAKATARVTECLRALTLSDRPEAVKQAQALLRNGIKANTGLMLEPLVRTLVAFPEEGQLKEYLARLGVLSGKGDDIALDHPLTVEDYLRLQGRLHHFDVETGTFPNGHHWLLAELAALAHSGLNKATFDEKPPQEYKSDEEPYLLTGHLDGRTWQMQARNFGDWYDVTTVLTLLNRMAAEGGYPERFIILNAEDQTARVVAIDKGALHELLAKGLLELPNMDRARILGREFEAAELRGVRSGR